MITLFKNHGAGRIGTWRIWTEGDTIYYDHSIVEGGAAPLNSEKVTVNQSGRSLDEQIVLRANSMISRHMDRGYKRTREEALQGNSNQLGLRQPMLAKKLKDVRSFDEANAMVQYKLDGHRCLITKLDGEITAYTRQGKIITTIPHILEPLRDILPDGWTLDGELYAHGPKLQTLSSWIKREQSNSQKLKLVVYDMMEESETFKTRYQELYDLFVMEEIDEHWPIALLTTMEYRDSVNAQRIFKMARMDGFEGLIIRTDDKGYEPGKRSSSLIKMKQFLDEDFIVLDVIPSKDGWGICVCAIGVNVFKASAPGTVKEKFEVIANKDKYIGRKLQVSFAEYTADGIPFQPTAVRWIDEI